MLLKWTEKYSVGHELIDLQHKMLFNIVNKLSEAIINGSGVEIIGEVLDDMSIYALLHFRTEEDLLEKGNYDDLVDHQAIHNSFKREIMTQTKSYINSPNEETAIEIHKFLMNWLTNHIMSEDILYTNHLV